METNQVSKPTTETTTAAPTPAADTYFKKAQYNMPLFIGGERIEFEPLGSNYGVIRVPAEDEATRTNLVRMSEAHRGVVQISLEEYENLKKKLPWTPSAPKSKQKLKVWERNFRRPQHQKSAASAAAESRPLASPPGVVGSGTVVGGGGAPAGPGVPLTPAFKRMSSAASGPVVRTPTIDKLAKAEPKA